MKATFVVPIAVLSALVLFVVQESGAIKCFVCQDCEHSFNETHLLNCSKNQDKCITMSLMSGEVDRMCADKNRCAGRGNGRNKRSLEDVLDEECIPKRRIGNVGTIPTFSKPYGLQRFPMTIVRQLLGGDGGSGNSNSNKNKNTNKNKEKPKEEKKGSRDASVITCCMEDGCNGGVGYIKISTLLLCTSLAFVTYLPIWTPFVDISNV